MYNIHLIAITERQMESKALICMALVYGCETCKLSKKQKTFLNLSKGEILR